MVRNKRALIYSLILAGSGFHIGRASRLVAGVLATRPFPTTTPHIATTLSKYAVNNNCSLLGTNLSISVFSGFISKTGGDLYAAVSNNYERFPIILLRECPPCTTALPLGVPCGAPPRIRSSILPARQDFESHTRIAETLSVGSRVLFWLTNAPYWLLLLAVLAGVPFGPYAPLTAGNGRAWSCRRGGGQ